MPTARRPFSQTGAVNGGDAGHEHTYDAPGGWLFGVKPGEQYEKEGWEGLMFWGFGGSIALAVVAYAFKPDTRYVWIVMCTFWGGGVETGCSREVAGLRIP